VLGFTFTLAAGVACGDKPEATITLTFGEEQGVLTRAPAPTTLIVEAVDTEDKHTEIAKVPLPTEQLDLGEQNRGGTGALSVRALDPTGATLVKGDSLFFQWGALESADLEVFVQRVGELARVPRGPAAFDAAIATMAVGRYAFAINGSRTMLYDFLRLKTQESAPVLPRAAKSIIMFETYVLAIDDAGGTTFELASGQSTDLTNPENGTFAEVAGGATIEAPDGISYLVGGTRPSGGATQKILKLDVKGALTYVSTAKAREGACAAWVEGRGLVIYGGNLDAPPEVVAPGAATGTELPFPADPVKNCALATLDGTHVVVAGGSGAKGDTGAGLPARVLDLTCASNCTPAPWQGPIALARAQAVALGPDKIFVVGDDAAGNSHAFRAAPSPANLREVPLKTGRRGARVIALPRGGAAIVGGGIGIEQYVE
jgi:hypothetical protein